MTGSREAFRKYTDAETFEKIREMDTIAEMWESVATEYADAPAIQDGEKIYSFRETEEEVALLRGLLTEKGLKQQSGTFSKKNRN